MFSISDEAISISSSSFPFIILLPYPSVTSCIEILLHHMTFAPSCGALYAFSPLQLHCAHRYTLPHSDLLSPYESRPQGFLPLIFQGFTFFQLQNTFFPLLSRQCCLQHCWSLPLRITAENPTFFFLPSKSVVPLGFSEFKSTDQKQKWINSFCDQQILSLILSIFHLCGWAQARKLFCLFLYLVFQDREVSKITLLLTSVTPVIFGLSKCTIKSYNHRIIE